MQPSTSQLEKWTGEFGQSFTDRNNLTLEEMDTRYTRDFGVSRSVMNREFLDQLPRDSRILEVGANIGNQLLYLQAMGFTNLWGLEPAEYSLDLARQRAPGMNLVKGTAFDLPFKDQWFDVVFTSVVLIHVHPEDLPKVLAEIHRCTRRYVWGFENHAQTLTEVLYRGNRNMQWKRDFAKAYLDQFPGLKLVKQQLFKYSTDENVDAMFLLEK